MVILLTALISVFGSAGSGGLTWDGHGLFMPGLDFARELDALSRGAACDGRPQLPGPAEKVLIAHCEKVTATIERWRQGWLSKAAPFFAELVPDGLPEEVVYPFGGADLLNALVVFPDKKVITIMALEPGGDPRSFLTLDKGALDRGLKLVRRHFDFLMRLQFSQTVDLAELVKGPLAGVLIYDIAALTALGYEPLSLRYFRLGEDGGRLYMTRAELSAIDATANKLTGAQRHKFLSESFAHFELRFRRKPATPEGEPGPVQVFRHLSVDLGDAALRKDPRLMKHLEAKGEVTVMTKAASNLLWWTPFSTIRNYLIRNAIWMVSDASGLAASDLDPAVWVQETWGVYDGAPFPSPDAREAAQVALWKANPQRPLDFYFGYHSKGGHPHLMVTRRKAP
jgi:hypothetical protein